MTLRVGLKWDYFEADVLGAWVAEMDFGLAPAISAALHQAIDQGLTGYPFPSAESAMADATVDFLTYMNGWTVPADWVYPAPDVVVAARRAITLLTEPGTPVVVHSPVYFPFYGLIDDAGRDVIEVISNIDQDGRYSLNLDGIERALDDGAGSILLCSPWNPTGRCFSRHETAELVELARKHKARVISDEIHAALTYPGNSHTPAATIDPDVVVTVTAASKAWNLPGLKCAQVILTSERDRERWEKQFTPEKVGVGTLGLLATIAAYNDSRGWLTETMDQLSTNRALLKELIPERLPKVEWSVPEATYLAWLDFSNYDLGNPAEFFVDKAKVALTAGTPFGTGADRHARLNFGTDTVTLTDIVDRMATALESV